MGKSKTGVNILFFALLAYVLVFFGNYQSLLLLLGFALIYEKNEWLTFQISQVLVLRIVYDSVSIFGNLIYKGFYDFISLFDSINLLNFISNFNKYVTSILYLFFLAILVFYFLKILFKKPVNIPLISNIVKKVIL